MIPTEHEGTVAVDAAARAHVGRLQHVPPFDELDPLTANAYRDAVLPVVWAALEALPDRPDFPAGLFLDLDAEREPCVWQTAPALGVDAQLVARRCDVSPTAWAILTEAASPGITAAQGRHPAGKGRP